MNKLYVLKDVAYAANAGGVIASINEVDELVPGAIAFFTERGTLLTAANAAANIGDQKAVQVAVGRVEDTQVITINRRAVDTINRVNYRAYTRPVTTIGTAAANGIVLTDTSGELFLKVQDTSFTNRNLTAMNSGTYYKQTATSLSDALDALVLDFNTNNELATAAKVTQGTGFGLTITPQRDNIAIDASVSGLLLGATVAVTTEAIYGVGVGADVLRLEQDFSIEEGNGNYIDYTPEWYSRVYETVTSATYDMITLVWDGVSSKPTGSRTVMHNRLVIAPINGATAGATNQSAAAILAIIALIFSNAYSGTTSSETGTDDGTDHDGVSGN